MWKSLELRRRLIYASIPLVVAIGILLCRFVTSRTDWPFHQTQQQVRLQQFHNLTRMMTLRMSRKAKELQKRGVKQPELGRVLDQEEEATRLEANRVMASGYKIPFQMNSP